MLTSEQLNDPIVEVTANDFMALIEARRNQGEVALQIHVIARARYRMEFAPAYWIGEQEEALAPINWSDGNGTGDL